MTSQVLFAVVCLATAIPTAFAGHPEPGKELKETVTESEFPFVKGANELEIGAGAYWTLDTTGGAELPDMGFAIGSISYGWMLSDVRGDGLCRGNWEFILSAFGGGIFEGPGDVLVGTNFTFRFNFVRGPRAVVVPFFELGGGGVYSDAANDDGVQRLLGADFSFDLQAAAGLRFMASDHFSINLKVEYRHFSNADIADRNHGVNGLGGVLGVSWFY